MYREIDIPYYTQVPKFKEIFESILIHDQFDDWLPDPVYYRDYERYWGLASEKLNAMWNSGKVGIFPMNNVKVPRHGDKIFWAANLNFNARICAYSVIANMATRISASMATVRDRVYGFEFRMDKAPLFSMPGEGLQDVWRLVYENIIADQEFTLLDITKFGTNAKIPKLLEVLRRSDAYNDDVRFINELIDVREKGLISIDDAFAYLYNFYLLPLDLALLKERIKFFRYRDEYLVSGNNAARRVNELLGDIDMHALPVIKFDSTTISELIVKANAAIAKDMKRTRGNADLHKDIDIGDMLNGRLQFEYNCGCWDDAAEHCCSDEYELHYNEEKPADIGDLFQLSPDDTVLDGLQILPMLRNVNKKRGKGVLDIGPFKYSPSLYLDYQRNLSRGRSWLTRALKSALRKRSDWQIVWVTAMYSDLGSMSRGEEDLLMQIVRDDGLGNIAKAHAILALARSGGREPSDFWSMPDTTSNPYLWRVALLGAHYLALKGMTGPWREIGTPVKRSEELLVKLLEEEQRR